MKASNSAILLLATSTLLSACGGGGSSDSSSSLSGSSSSDAVPLATNADVIRELGNIGAVTAVIRTANIGGGTTTSPATAHVSRALLTPKSDGLQAEATTTQNCTAGGNAAVTGGSASHTFSYFGVTQSVTYAIADFSNCVETQKNPDGTTTTATLNNHGEAGYTATASDGSEYLYTLLGSGTTAISVHDMRSTANGSVTLDATDLLLGTVEAYTKGTFDDARTILKDNHTENRSTGVYTAAITLGSGNTPFKLTQTGGTTGTLDGPYTYKTSLCVGGALTLATPSTLASDSNGYPVGGALKFASGNASATISFNADGSASISFSTGGSGTLTTAQVHTALDTTQC